MEHKSCRNQHGVLASTLSDKGICATCWMRQLVDDGEIEEAYAVADDHDRPRSAVRIMIRDRDERALRLSERAIDAILDTLSH